MAAVLTQVAGGLLAAAQYSGLLTIIPQGQIGGIDVQATLEEIHTDTLEVTDHPVQDSAPMTDHSFVRPTQLLMRCGWSNSSLAAAVNATLAQVADSFAMTSDTASAIHSQLRALQQSRQPFTVITTLRQYTNMLLTSLQVTRDHTNSQALMVTATLRSNLFASPKTTTMAAISNQANPQSTADTAQLGPRALIPTANTVITRMP